MNYDSLVKGIDCSHWNGAIDWPKLAADGVTFAYIKATQGMDEDPMFATNATGANNAGVIPMAYPFIVPTDTVDCIEKFDSVVGPTMPAVLDAEVAGDAAAVSLWINGMNGRPTMIYIGMSPPFAPPLSTWTLPRILPEYRATPRLPAWDGVSEPDWQNEWVIWQRSEQGTFAGETGNFDLDVLAVSLDRFNNWCATGSWNSVPGA